MATFWCRNCETTFQQDALSEQHISCPHCLTELQPVVKVSDISSLRLPPDHQSPASGNGDTRKAAEQSRPRK
jgi:hypothetical protein